MTEEILTDSNTGFVLLIEINKSRRDLHLHSSFLTPHSSFLILHPLLPGMERQSILSTAMKASLGT